MFRADLAAPDGVETLAAEVAGRGLAIELLVNNAGFGLRRLFAELPIDRQLAMLDVNCRAPMALCHAILPQMIARGSGRILNVASTAGFQPGPWLAIYYASKAFLLHFSEALHEEVKGQGISVTALCPGPVATEFTDVAGMKDNPLFDRYAASPDVVVAAGPKALATNMAVTIPGASNVVTAALNRLLPRGTIRRLHGGYSTLASTDPAHRQPDRRPPSAALRSSRGEGANASPCCACRSFSAATMRGSPIVSAQNIGPPVWTGQP